MHFRDAVPLSARFRHICRPLEPGEDLPKLPSLSEQLLACCAEVERQATSEDEEAWDFEEGELLDDVTGE